jgi:HEAT repeat protein
MSEWLGFRKQLGNQRVPFKLNSLRIAALATILSLLIILSSAAPTYTQAPEPCSANAPPACRTLVLEIKATAARHFELGSLRTGEVKQEFEAQANQVGLTTSQIGVIYEEEYIKLTNAEEPGLWEQLRPNIGWLAASLLVVWVILQDTLKKRATTLVELAENSIYNRFAGSKWFRGIALQRYRQALVEKHRELHIPFRPNRPLQMQEVYVPLKVAGTSDSEQIDANQVIAESRRLMVKGPPGSGKSMLLKHLTLSYAEGGLNMTGQPVPILLDLHRLSDPQISIEQHLAETLARDDFPHAERFVAQGLKSGNLMLLLDGLDEVNSADRKQVVKRIKDWLDKCSKCRAVITCRSQVYNGEFAEAVDQTLEVVEFTDKQIRTFLGSWERDMPREKSIEQLMQTLHDRPRIMALARNPLLLTIIAYLYTDTRFVLPHSRAEFYQKSTDILLDQWYQEYNQFQARDKRLVLRHLALYNQDSTNYQQQDRRSIDYQTVLAQVQQVLPGLNLPPGNTVPLLDEIVERSGLLLEIDGGERYQFAHLTLQEFFAAAALLENGEELVTRFTTDPDAWRETVKLWCGLAGDSTALIWGVYDRDSITAFECLADAQKVDQVLAEDIINSFKLKLSTVEERDAVIKAFGAVAADTRPRGQAVFKFLEETLTQHEELTCRTAAANALSQTNLPNAAQVLANCYSYSKDIRQALIRMGDLAVPKLESLAASGATSALYDLMEVGTTDAVEALTPFLWHSDQGLKEQTAWILAALLPQPTVEDALRKHTLNEEQRRSESLTWIWQPFEEAQNLSLSIITGRIAYLLAQPSTTAAPDSLKLDPRLVIPLCSIQNGKIFASLLKRGVKKLDKTVVSTIRGMAYSVSEQEISQLIEKVILDSKGNSSHWHKLFSYLSPTLQLELLYRLTNYRLPTRDDWRNSFRPVKYKFRTSWHYWVVLVLSAATSSLALVRMLYVLIHFSENWISWSAIPMSIIVIDFWIFLWRSTDQFLEPRLFVNFGLLGPKTFLVELRRLFLKQLVWIDAESFLKIMSGQKAISIFTFNVAVIAAATVAENFVAAVAVAVAGTITIVVTGAGIIAVADAYTTVTGTVATAGASIIITAIAAVFAAVLAGFNAASLTGANGVAFSGTGAFLCAGAGAAISTGVGFWVRAKSKRDVGRFFAVLTMPFFCCLPIVVYFSTTALLTFLSWQYTALIWLAMISICAGLWNYGQWRDRQARNPLQGILDPPARLASARNSKSF